MQQVAKVRVTRIEDPSNPHSPLRTPHRDLLSDLNPCSQKASSERFDSSVGAGTVLWPFGGKHQLTPPDAMVAKLSPVRRRHRQLHLHELGPRLPRGRPSTARCMRSRNPVCKAVAAGGRLSDVRLTLQEYFPKLGNDATRWGLPFAGIARCLPRAARLCVSRRSAARTRCPGPSTIWMCPLPSCPLRWRRASRAAPLAGVQEGGSTLSLVEVSRDEDNLPDYARLKQAAELLHQLNAEGKIISMKALGAGGLMHGIATSASAMASAPRSLRVLMPMPSATSLS